MKSEGWWRKLFFSFNNLKFQVSSWSSFIHSCPTYFPQWIHSRFREWKRKAWNSFHFAFVLFILHSNCLPSLSHSRAHTFKGQISLHFSSLSLHQLLWLLLLFFIHIFQTSIFIEKFYFPFFLFLGMKFFVSHDIEIWWKLLNFEEALIFWWQSSTLYDEIFTCLTRHVAFQSSLFLPFSHITQLFFSSSFVGNVKRRFSTLSTISRSLQLASLSGKKRLFSNGWILTPWAEKKFFIQ